MRLTSPASRPFLLLLLLGILGIALVTTATDEVLGQVPGDQEGAPEAAPPAVPPADTVYTLVMKGGFLMVAIGLCSIVVVTVAIERLISLRSSRTVSPGLIDEVYDLLEPGKVKPDQQDEAAELLGGSASLLGTILEVGVRKVHRGAAYTEAFLTEATAKASHLLQRKLRPFSTVAQLAPLLGLLGTVYGMIICFGEAAAADSASRAETLAQGIYQALVTTAAGLTVAIPSLVLFHYFQGRVDRVVDQLEEAVTDFLDHYYGEELPSRQPHAPPAEPPRVAPPKPTFPPRPPSSPPRATPEPRLRPGVEP